MALHKVYSEGRQPYVLTHQDYFISFLDGAMAALRIVAQANNDRHRRDPSATLLVRDGLDQVRTALDTVGRPTPERIRRLIRANGDLHPSYDEALAQAQGYHDGMALAYVVIQVELALDLIGVLISPKNYALIVEAVLEKAELLRVVYQTGDYHDIYANSPDAREWYRLLANYDVYPSREWSNTKKTHVSVSGSIQLSDRLAFENAARQLQRELEPLGLMGDFTVRYPGAVVLYGSSPMAPAEVTALDAAIAAAPWMVTYLPRHTHSQPTHAELQQALYVRFIDWAVLASKDVRDL